MKEKHEKRIKTRNILYVKRKETCSTWIHSAKMRGPSDFSFKTLSKYDSHMNSETIE